MTATSVPGSVPVPAHPTTAERELAWPGRIGVGLLTVAGLAFAVQGDFALLWYVPFAAVGALLAIRRPATTIGWILLACGWGFAIVQVPVHARAELFAAGTVDPLTVALTLAGVAAGPTVFLLFATLAIVFPSGRLPAGRWGGVARVSLAVAIAALVLGLVEPTLAVNLWGSGSQAVEVRNPIAVLPRLPVWRFVNADTFILPIVLVMAGSAVSLFVRYRRARGVERQQLKWIAAALVAVAVGVLGGFALTVLFPAAGASGIVWLGAALAFPLLPIAVGVAVLRYRLYDIDTIINRAIVYGLLTAVLAGASAATIGITRQLFEGLLGPGSDVSIVVSTLVVVSAFEPIKKRIQALVDRRFHDASDPAAALDALVRDVRDSIGRPDPERTMRRVLAVAIAACHASAGRATWALAAGPPKTVTESAAPSGRRRPKTRSLEQPAVVHASAAAGGATATLDLEGVADPTLVAPLESVLAAILAEVTA